jgi:hypothetical protein
VPTLKGIHYAIESGIMAAEAAFRSLQRGESPSRAGALESYDEELRASYVVKDLNEVRNMRQVFDKGFFLGGALASAMTVTKGKLPPKEYPIESNAERTLIRTDRASSYPAPDGKLTFDKLSSVFLSGKPDARRPAQPHPDPAAGAARPRRPVGEHVPRARLRGGRRRRRRPGARRGEPVELRPVRRDQRQGRPA